MQEQEQDSDSKEVSSSTNSSYQHYPKPTLHDTLANMTEEELERYKAFRRSTFNKNGIRKLVNNTLNQTCNANFIIAINGVAKVFVGEIVEMAKIVLKERNETGPLKPAHVHEAYRRLYKKMPHLKIWNKNTWF